MSNTGVGSVKANAGVFWQIIPVLHTGYACYTSSITLKKKFDIKHGRNAIINISHPKKSKPRTGCANTRFFIDLKYGRVKAISYCFG